jgi:flavin-dependent dehydrogenase
MSLRNVEANYNATVKNLLVADDKVIGIIVEETGEEVQADLVIDSLGKAGRTLYWLDKMGFDRPEENVVDCDFAYTSVFMKPNNPDVFTDVGFFVAPDINAEHRRIAALVTMEDGLWITLVGGRYGDYPPRDMAGFLEYAETLIDPTFRDLLAQAEPVGEPAHFRFPKGIRRRFDKLENFPDGLLPIGDSFCHFNPAYGQGMTSACRQAMGLRRVLQDTITSGEGLEGIWRNLFPISYQETRAPWLFACLADFMHPKCTGDFPEEEMEIFSVYQFVVELAFKGDREALGTFLDIANLKAPLQSLEKSKWPDVYAESIAAKESTN